MPLATWLKYKIRRKNCSLPFFAKCLKICKKVSFYNIESWRYLNFRAKTQHFIFVKTNFIVQNSFNPIVKTVFTGVKTVFTGVKTVFIGVKTVFIVAKTDSNETFFVNFQTLCIFWSCTMEKIGGKTLSSEELFWHFFVLRPTIFHCDLAIWSFFSDESYYW